MFKRLFSKAASRCTTYCFIATGVYSFGIYVLNSVCVHLFGTGVWVIMGNILCVCYGHNRHQLSFQIQLVILPFLITVRCREAATCRYCFYSVAKKTVAEKLWIRSKNGCTFYDGHDELYHHAKFGEDHTMCAGYRCENVVFLCFLFFFVFFCQALSPEHRAFEGCIVRTSIALPFINRFQQGLQHFFHKRLHFQMHYIVLTFVARWHHNFR